MVLTKLLSKHVSVFSCFPRTEMFASQSCTHQWTTHRAGSCLQRGGTPRRMSGTGLQLPLYIYFFNHLSNSLFSPFCQSTFQHFDPTKLKIGTKMLSSQINLCFGVCAGFMLLMLISRSFEFLCDVTQLPFLYCLHSLPLSHYPPINTG